MPKNCFELIEEALKHHKAVMTTLTSEAKESAATQELILATLTSQVQQLIADRNH